MRIKRTGITRGRFILERIGEDHAASGGCNINRCRKREDIDDHNHVRDCPKLSESGKTPLTTNLEFRLIECHTFRITAARRLLLQCGPVVVGQIVNRRRLDAPQRDWAG